MIPKKKIQLLLLNSAIVLGNVCLFSNALLGVSLVSGTALSMSLGWSAVVGSFYAFVKGNSMIMKKSETRGLIQNINSLESCVAVFEAAIRDGDVFDDHMLKNIAQIKRFRKKQATINDILLQKFSSNEMSFQKFSGVLQEIENVIYMNMRSILNKVSVFDEDDYNQIMQGEWSGSKFSQEKMEIYEDYIKFVDNATMTNENILLKLDKMLLEISDYNSVDSDDIQQLPAVAELDELIKHAKLYK